MSVFTSSTLFSSWVSATPNDIELPTGAQVVQGKINFETSNNHLNVTQDTQNGIINWNTFNIGQNASVHFQLPGSSSSTLNRVTSATPSQIFGNLTSNGQIFLLNPSGVYFGSGARVNVGSLIASTQSMSNEDFLSQNYLFSQTELSGEIVNQGSIIGEQIAMVSPRFTNLGDILATSGDVVVASGDKVKLAITQNQSIAVELDASQVANLIDNQGTINAQGNIVFKADAMQSIVDQTIKLPQSANMMVSDNGTVRLVTNSGSVKATNVAMDAGALGGTYNNGVIDVSHENFQGGNISLTGHEVKVATLSKLNASGGKGGGSILIGGDWQGQSGTRQATFTLIDAGAYLDASAVQFGHGGKIVAWSDISNPLSHTAVHGNLAATAGIFGGNGGKIETSGYHLSIDDLAINVSANSGVTGDWLIDPVDFTVAASGGDITGSLLTSNLGSANVTILSSSGSSGSGGNITINDAVTWSANKLTLNANNNIYINADLLGSGTAQLDLLYGQGAVASGNESDYTIAKNSSGFSAKVDLPDGENFSTKLGSDGSTVSYTVISSLSFADTGNFAFGRNITDAGSYSRGVKNNFSGNIDGLGHTIDGLTIDHPGGAGWDTGGTGFFAGAYNSTGITAEVSNLGLTNMSQTSIRGFAGAFIGRCNTNCSATIKNSYATGVITNSGGNALGGIVGAVDGTLNIKNSFSNVAVTGSGVTIANSNEGVGGLIGRTGLSATVSIMNSHNRGSVTGTNSWTGGLIGYSYGSPTITSSYNAGSVSGKNDTGGLIGYAQSALTLTSSYNTGAISSSSNDLGGLVGYANASNTLTSSYNTGTVTGTANYIGGLVGYASAAQTISSSYNTGAISDSTGTNGNVGGLVGALGSSDASTIQGSYNTGAVYGGWNVGGLVGAAYNASITTSYNTETVTGFYCPGGNCNNPGGVGGLLGTNMTARSGSTYVTISESYNQGTIKGPTGVGGLVGQGRNNTISDSYNKGNVSGSFSYNGQGVSTWLTNYNGGIIGRTDGGTTLSRLYNKGLRVNQDSSTSYVGVHGNFIGTKADVFYLAASTGSVSSGQRALSSSDMQTLSNFTNYDSEIWTNNSSVNSGYPLLINNDPVAIITFAANDLSFTYGTTVDTSSFLANNYYTILGGYSLAEAFSTHPGFGIYLGDLLISDTTPNAGSYTITPSGGVVNSGFILSSYNSGALTVNPRALTVDAIAYSNKTYDGDAVADVTLSVSGTVGDETLSYTPTATFASRNVGTQTVTVDTIGIADGTGDADNYSITTGQTGTATISQLNSVAWTGSGGNSFWSNAANWAGSAIPDASNVGIVNIGSADTVTFNADSVGSMNSVINNSGALTLNTDSSYTLSSQISGIGSINKEGSGTFTLSSVENNYSGDTTISAGTLQINGLLGQGNYSADINNASSLKLNTSATQTLSGDLSGAGDLIKAGSNSLIITQANSGFTGNVALNNGLIQTRNNTALGSTGRISIASGAAIDIQGYSLNNPFTIAGTGIVNSGAIYNSATSGLSQLSGNIILDQTASINSGSDIIFGGSILGQAGENNSLTINAAEKTVTLNGLIGADPYTYSGTSGANPYALSVTAGTININNNISTNQNQTYTGNVVVGGNQSGSSGEERILLSLNPSITMNGSIDDETTSTHSLTLRSITQLGYSDIPSITLNATVGATKPLNDLNLIAMYDPAPDGYYGKIPSTRDTSPYYTGSIDIQSNVNVSDEIILTGRTVDLNDATLSASNIELYGYASLAGGVIDLGTGSVFGSGNFASMNAVNGAEYFAVEIAAEAAAVAAAEAAAVAAAEAAASSSSSSSSGKKAARAASQVAANIQTPRVQSIKIPASFKAPTPIAIAAPRATVTVGSPAPRVAPAPAPRVAPAVGSAPAPRAGEGTPKAAGPASSSAAPSPGSNGDAAPPRSQNSSGGSSSSTSSSDSNSTTGSSSNSSGGDSSSSGGDSSSSGGDSKSSDDED